MTTLTGFDPHSESFYQDPYPAYALMRSEAPVFEIPDTPGLFFVTTWPLVRSALMDPELFSSVLPPARRTTPPPEVAEEVERLRAQGFAYTPALGTNDPPQHTRYRKMVNRAFTVRSLAWMEPLVDEVADQIALALPDGEVVDALQSITVPLPVWAIMRILGIDDRYRGDLRRWSDSSTAALGGKLSADRWLDAERDMLEFQQVICGILDERRANPTDDLLSTLVRAEEGETPLTVARRCRPAARCSSPSVQPIAIRMCLPNQTISTRFARTSRSTSPSDTEFTCVWAQVWHASRQIRRCEHSRRMSLHWRSSTRRHCATDRVTGCAG